MAKERGSIHREGDGRWVARITYVDDLGKRRQKRRVFTSKTEARDELTRLKRTLEDRGGRALEADRMTFGILADYFEKTYLIEAQYVDGRKVAGLRSVDHPRRHLKKLREFFGNRLLRSITHGDIERFRAVRLATPIEEKKEKKDEEKQKKQRSIASVNRELAVLRRMLNIACRQGWLLRSPFTLGDTLISLADERKRERILTREEEDRLLAQCSVRKAHLRPIVIAALDTGMRKGELFKLVWSDVDFETKTIKIRAFNTKTMQERTVAMTTRLGQTLWELYQSSSDPDARVFGIHDNVKSAFTSARNDAGLPDVRFHDLRHTAASRLVAGHVPLAEVGRVLGHTQANTTYRYVNANVETARRAAAALDAFQAESEAATASEPVN